jgi:hypothetical protein
MLSPPLPPYAVAAAVIGLLTRAALPPPSSSHFFVLRRIVLFHIELKMGFSLLEYVAALLDMHWWWKAGSTRD